MTVLDAYALTAHLAGEAAAADVAPLLVRAQTHIASANLAEVFDRLMRLKHFARSDIDERVDALVRIRALSVITLDDQTARRAGELRSGFYDREQRAVSLADCICAATAEALDDVVATADPRLAAMARAIDVGVVPLPDSRGNRP